MNKETMAAILPGERNKEIDNKSKGSSYSLWFESRSLTCLQVFIVSCLVSLGFVISCFDHSCTVMLLSLFFSFFNGV